MLRRVRHAAALCALSTLLVGCGEPTEKEITQQADSLSSLAAESGILLRAVADDKVTSNYAQAHTEELDKEADKSAEELMQFDKTKELGNIAKDIADTLADASQKLEDAPHLRDLASRLDELAEKASDKAEAS